VTDPAEERVFSRDLTDPWNSRRAHARAVQLGLEHRVSRGVYLPSESWQGLHARERHLLLARSVAETRRFTPVLSHWSAAAVHGLPVLGEWPAVVHMTSGVTSGGRSRNGVVKHSRALNDADVVELDGLTVTSAERTVIDLAASSSFVAGVVTADAALHVPRKHAHDPLTTAARLLESWNRMLPFRGHRRAFEAIEFAVLKADSPLESVSRVTMREIGCPQPELQVSFFDRGGFVAEVDFCWTGFRAVGEADGESKYLDPGLRGGRTAEQVVLDEKYREDRLRALGLTPARWNWRTARDPAALRAKLEAAGLRW
jgi:hypothetical protein